MRDDLEVEAAILVDMTAQLDIFASTRAGTTPATARDLAGVVTPPGGGLVGKSGPAHVDPAESGAGEWAGTGEILWCPASDDHALFAVLPTSNVPVVVHYCNQATDGHDAVRRLLDGFERWTLDSSGEFTRDAFDGGRYVRIMGNFAEFSMAFCVSVLCGTWWELRLAGAFRSAARAKGGL